MRTLPRPASLKTLPTVETDHPRYSVIPASGKYSIVSPARNSVHRSAHPAHIRRHDSEYVHERPISLPRIHLLPPAKCPYLHRHSLQSGTIPPVPSKNGQSCNQLHQMPPPSRRRQREMPPSHRTSDRLLI